MACRARTADAEPLQAVRCRITAKNAAVMISAPPAQVAAFQKAEVEKWAQVIKAANIKVD